MVVQTADFGYLDCFAVGEGLYFPSFRGVFV
jgi:hypothetical protein